MWGAVRFEFVCDNDVVKGGGNRMMKKFIYVRTFRIFEIEYCKCFWCVKEFKYTLLFDMFSVVSQQFHSFGVPRS